MTETLLASFGLYGGALLIAFASGLFPLISVELFLVGVATLRSPPLASMVVMIALAVLGHQLAKTITYYAGIRGLAAPSGRVRRQLDRARVYIERWNRYPKLVLLFATTVGLPPMYVIGFVAKPLMNIELLPFTLWTVAGRTVRYATLTAIPLLF